MMSTRPAHMFWIGDYRDSDTDGNATREGRCVRGGMAAGESEGNRHLRQIISGGIFDVHRFVDFSDPAASLACFHVELTLAR